MKGKIGLEEHFAIDDTLKDFKGVLPRRHLERGARAHPRPAWPQASPDGRVRHGDDDPVAERAGDPGASPTPKRPTRSRARPTTISPSRCISAPTAFRRWQRCRCRTPTLPRRELERCVKDLGMVGALANGFSQVGDPNTIAYLDEKQYWPFWERVRRSSTCRSTCIRATRCRRTPASTRTTTGCSDRSGRSAMKPRCMRCG